ncbi:MAG: chorismate-binding protein, partial [Nocardioides sp.]
MDDVESFFADISAEHARCFWLDGGGAREWSGRRSMVGWLDDDDVSLTFHAGPREVRRHAGGRVEVVGSDVFDVLEAELAAGPDDAQWFGYLGYAARPDLFPARPDPDLPDAVWMRATHLRFFDHELGIGHERRSGTGYITPLVPNASVRRPPVDYAAAFDRVQEHLHAGNSYEVNLTYRLETPSDLSPLAAYLRLRAVNPAPYAGFLQHDVPGHRAWLLSSSPERYALVTADRVLETKPIKGTTARGDTAEEDDAARVRLAGDPK